MNGVKIGDDTTMTLPHKRLELGGKVYFVATFPEGDLAIHEWNPRYQQGYGGSKVGFLLEDGTFEEVKGPFDCGDIFDHGRSAKISEILGIEAKPAASRIIVGKHLETWAPTGTREVCFEETALSCEPLAPRLEAAMAGRKRPFGRMVALEHRNSVVYLTDELIAKIFQQERTPSAGG